MIVVKYIVIVILLLFVIGWVVDFYKYGFGAFHSKVNLSKENTESLAQYIKPGVTTKKETFAYFGKPVRSSEKIPLMDGQTARNYNNYTSITWEKWVTPIIERAELTIYFNDNDTVAEFKLKMIY